MMYSDTQQYLEIPSSLQTFFLKSGGIDLYERSRVGAQVERHPRRFEELRCRQNVKFKL